MLVKLDVVAVLSEENVQSTLHCTTAHASPYKPFVSNTGQLKAFAVEFKKVFFSKFFIKETSRRILMSKNNLLSNIILVCCQKAAWYQNLTFTVPLFICDEIKTVERVSQFWVELAQNLYKAQDRIENSMFWTVFFQRLCILSNVSIPIQVPRSNRTICAWGANCFLEKHSYLILTVIHIVVYFEIGTCDVLCVYA